MLDPNNHDSHRLRIAFSNIEGGKWTAGLYYLKNLFSAIRALPVDVQPEIVLLISQKTEDDSYQELLEFVDEVIEWTPLGNKRPGANIINIFSRVTGKKLFREKLSHLLRRNNVDIFFTRGAPPLHFALPVLSWIPDFQHLHFPELFSEQEIRSREMSCFHVAERATRVVVSSQSALNDFQAAIPAYSSKGRVLSFVSQIPETIYHLDCKTVCRKYHLPDKFFLLPNQFWKHKNHHTVINALKIALNSDQDITIVCTGNTNEYRDDLYFSELICSISELGLREKMVLLGLVPRQDLLLLMRQSIAVIQPSLFEGWNTAVEEAKSLGKRLIVSDIAVHREQGSETVQYFPPKDAEKLAKLLVDVFKKYCAGPDEPLEKKAIELLRKRTEMYGECFMSIVTDARPGK